MNVPQKVIVFFRFHPQCDKKLQECFDSAWECEGNRNTQDRREKATKIILDQFGESMVRLGLLQPCFEIENPEFITERKFAIVVLDTNALRNGAVHHLQEKFPTAKLWIIIPTVALMEIGEKAANIKK